MILIALAMINIATTLPTLLFPEPIPDGDFIQPPEGTQAMSEHVLLLVLDGVPKVVFDDESIMPFMSNFETVGARVDVQTSFMTLTGPCVKEMSTGRKAANIDALRNWGVENDGQDDPFHYAMERGDNVAFTGFYVWANLYTDSRFIHQTVYDHGFSDISEADDEILAIVDTWVSAGNHDLMVAHLGGTDHAGHIHGLESPVYAERMNKLDQQLEALFRSLPDDWTLLITADHGMNVNGGHAIGTGAAAEEVYLFVGGAGIIPGDYNNEIEQRDISGLITVLRGLPMAISSEARIPLMILNLDEQTKMRIESWNWNATFAHHQWRSEQGLSSESLSKDLIQWELADIDQTGFPWLSIIVAIGSICLVGGWLVGRNIRSNEFKNFFRSPWLAVVVVFSFTVIATNSFAYDWKIGFLTMRWLRKLLGIVPIIFVVALSLKIMLSRQENNRLSTIPEWVPVAVLIALMFNPSIRWTNILFPFCFILVIFLFNQRSDPQSRRMFIGIIPVLFLLFWKVADYLPRFLTTNSLSELTGFHALYKITQVLVLNLMPQHLLAGSIFILLGMLALRGSSIDGRRPLKMIDGWLPLVILLFAWFGNSWMDRVLILMMMVLIIQCFTKKLFIDSNLSWTNGEIIVFLFIIPTWGLWPAMNLVLFHRLIPLMMKGYRTLIPENPTPLQRKISIFMPTALLFSSAAMVWFLFAQLTPFGLLEFNPSKIIVSGGFYGARTSPPISWMVAMIGGPLFASIALLHSRWISEGLSINDSLFHLSIILFSLSVMFWLSAIYPSVLQMLGPTIVVYLTWFVVWIGCELYFRRIIESRTIVSFQEIAQV